MSPTSVHHFRHQWSLQRWKTAVHGYLTLQSEHQRLKIALPWVEPILADSARARRCAPRTERNGGFGFQTKDPFLNQRRWTCWFSCRKKHASPVSDSQFSFSFRFEKLVIFAVYLTLHRGQASRSSEKHGQASRDWNWRARVLQWLR